MEFAGGGRVPGAGELAARGGIRQLDPLPLAEGLFASKAKEQGRIRHGYRNIG
jgi:hypothetical protein